MAITPATTVMAADTAITAADIITIIMIMAADMAMEASPPIQREEAGRSMEASPEFMVALRLRRTQVLVAAGQSAAAPVEVTRAVVVAAAAVTTKPRGER